MHTSSTLFVSSLVLLLSACGASFKIRDGGGGPVECAVEKPFYQDADGDGWGDGAMGAEYGCVPNTVSGFIVRNALDCNDDPATGGAGNGGKIGAICPSHFYAGGTAPVVGVIGNAAEFVAALPGAASPPIGAGQAAQACELGWGPQTDGLRATLAVADGAALALVQAAIDGAGVSTYAGFIGVENVGGSWKWDDGRDFAIAGVAPLTACGGALPAGADFPTGARLALVKNSTGWCVGTPGQAGGTTYAQPGGEPTRDVAGANDNLAGHFVCSRPKPDPFNFRAMPEADAESEDEG